MAKRTKETALAQLKTLLAKTKSLRGGDHLNPEHTRWIFSAGKVLSEVFGEESTFYASFFAIRWVYQGTMVVHIREAFVPGATEARYNVVAYDNALNLAIGILAAAHDELSASDLDSVYHGKNTAPEASLIITVLNLVERQLRKMIRDQPTSEKAFQEKVEDLLIGANIEYLREAPTFEYSTKTYKPDFTISRADLAIEVKLCAKPEREKEMIAEINDDILAYKTKWGNVLFVIYDCGIIRDVDRFVGHFERSTNVIVRVIKH
jgi:hypothetical protein